jgi:predicted  nucleic acid-binding Zn-ribbon protein
MEYKQKSFWKRPEGVTGALVLAGLIGAGGYLIYTFLGAIIAALSNTLFLAGMLVALFALIYVVLDPKARNLVWYMYKSAMRWITGLFVKMDPIGIMKSYVEDLKDNLGKMNKQITKLRSQMHQLREQIFNNKKQIESSLGQAQTARDSNQESIMVLKSRQAGRLQESNIKLTDLYRKMEILFKVLNRMYQSSEVLAEDITDQVKLKEQERAAIHASHSAMRSAMSVIKGDKDQRALFDEALEHMADDISLKVGEMEQFMEISENFMSSVDLQNGMFEEEGIKMLEKWEKDGVSKLLGKEKDLLVSGDKTLVLDSERPERQTVDQNNPYDDFFNEK